MRNAIALSSALALALAACGGSGKPPGDDLDAAAGAAPDLPSPGDDPAGSVTGMPAPGSGDGDVSLGAEPVPAEAPSIALPDGQALPGTGLPLPGGPEAAPPPGAATAVDRTRAGMAPAGGAGPDEAMSTIRRYYSAISAGDYAGAHQLWSGGGSASGQSLEQFASGFADTADVRVHMMEPEAPGAAAGSRYIRVPVTITATRRDGGTVQYTGSYTLRQPNDGSGSWRIDSADLREVQR